MTSIILLIAGFWLIGYGNWALGVVLILCSFEVSNKDDKVSRLKKEVAQLKLPKEKK